VLPAKLNVRSWATDVNHTFLSNFHDRRLIESAWRQKWLPFFEKRCAVDHKNVCQPDGARRSHVGRECRIIFG
jgi:hypothetical protein